MEKRAVRWALLISANVLFWSVLGLYQTGVGAPQGGQPPFANSVQQRSEMIRELREIRVLLREQNALLRAAHPDARTDGKQRR